MVDSPRVALFNHQNKCVMRISKEEMNYTPLFPLTLDLYRLPENCHLTKEAQSQWRAAIKGTQAYSLLENYFLKCYQQELL